jgi:hypothetical protein
VISTGVWLCVQPLVALWPLQICWWIEFQIAPSEILCDRLFVFGQRCRPRRVVFEKVAGSGIVRCANSARFFGSGSHARCGALVMEHEKEGLSLGRCLEPLHAKIGDEHR